MTNEQLAQIAQYTAMRNAPRGTMRYGVYPNCVKALRDYDALQSWLVDNLDWQQSHADMIADVAPHIATLQQAMATIIKIMEEIDRAAPGTFEIVKEPDANEQRKPTASSSRAAAEVISLLDADPAGITETPMPNISDAGMENGSRWWLPSLSANAIGSTTLVIAVAMILILLWFG